MRGRWGAIAFCGLTASIACVDLFHSTATPSLCDLDASAPGCDGSAEAAPSDLCAADAGAAHSRALRACSWLSACEHPVGQNATGACMVNAVLAYDCEANPNRKPKAKTQAFWQCMLTVATCGDVARCVMPGGVGGCANGGFIGCSQGGSNPSTRFDCVQATDGAAPAENCAMTGQTCDSLDRDAANDKALCVGPLARSCTTSSGCVGSMLSLCDDGGIDHGYDCTDFGSGACDNVGASPACKPEGAGNCAGTNDIRCTSGNVVAQGCVTGTPESVDCTSISGKGTCNPIEGGAPGVIPSDACWVDGGCTADSCDAGTLVACVRGRAIAVDCTALGLKTCNPVQTNEGFVASCVAP